MWPTFCPLASLATGQDKINIVIARILRDEMVTFRKLKYGNRFC
jgi:hypothetical protein